jgi:hypothetical protein
MVTTDANGNTIPYAGVDYGAGANASDTAGNIGPVSTDNPFGTG